MKKLFGALALALVLTGAGCASSVSDSTDSSATTSGRSTALQFHIETATGDLAHAIDVTDKDSLSFVKGSVTYAGLTIPSAISIADTDGDTEASAKLTEANTKLNATLGSATTIAELQAGVQEVIDILNSL